ncbi:hypothetical protein M2324_001644 [Rhodovulum sulfidophilum]|uniref:DUF3489 domain-containing protein n=1 Tax=Rhodovulum sulfidophilum TaxID=35806 RepID=UPI000AF88971|nr:DUF3489 domain-containing protein [Rhodovulum sulfidophilum]MCW2303251.1 hypothetical protein [Rhodovulum sulfidophilum]
MLRAEGGATIDEIVAETGWQPHTVRGAFAGALSAQIRCALRRTASSSGSFSQWVPVQTNQPTRGTKVRSCPKWMQKRWPLP